MDLVIGKKAHKKQNLLVIVERKSRLGLAIKVVSKNPFEIHKKLNMLIKKYDLTIKSITIDNGIEFEKISIFGKQKIFKYIEQNLMLLFKEVAMNILMV
ncbi:hypothetical protein K6988_00425 [Mycoplasmopsis synoviae]|uniref:hypothetical protein n=1 Tax=Mycoplasmopsis synoviae TaxID=2109 RepID=UPI001CE1D7D4|nr:hypothetical protein [Mycoplasmopsis synoviae]UBX99422.1 hypothetical protein K6988_00425 [Mycoplasmopsis synoviae]